MSKKQLALTLTFYIIIYLIITTQLATATQGNIDNNLKDYLKPYDVAFLIRADLNKDGKDEKITLYRQWDGEDPDYSDDQWYILCVFDDESNVLYMKDVSYFQEVGSFAVKDRDGDGLKEIIVLLDQVECWEARMQVYGWEGDSYRFKGEFKHGDNAG